MLLAAGWQTELTQFARATNLAVTLFDAEGALRAGPFTPTPLAEQLLAAGGWATDAGQCFVADGTVARECMAENSIVHRKGLDALALFAVPVRIEENPIGAIVAGWVFDNFPDPVSTDRLAKTIGVAYPQLWQVVRQQPPVSQEKLKIYADLLQTLCDSLMRERAVTLQEQEQSRELRALIESGQRLTAATSVEEIGAAVLEAAMAMARTNRARFLVVGADGEWRTVVAQGFMDVDAPQDSSFGAERRKMTGSLRVPIEAADGSALGLIEASETGGFPEINSQAQMSALAAQAAVALQKVRLIADLERKSATFERANRIKDEFLSVLSHELRTPLTPILGWIKMLRSGGLLRVENETVNTALAAIERNARQELHLVDEMLDLSRILNDKVLLEPELINPTDALASAFAAAQTLAAQRQLHLKLDTDQNLPLISADPKRLQQILSNLASNAVKFTADGGFVTLGARRAGEEAIEFTIADTGVGINAEALPHIFDRFQQADSTTTRRFGGLGIGLSVVRGLVELHGGRVWVESDGEGRGAIFVVRFPVANVSKERFDAQALVRRSMNQKPIEHEPQRSGRILVIDDSADTLIVLKAMIEQAGYHVETADSVEAALEAACRFRPDAIICDIGMPEADGFEFLKRLRATEGFTHTPVIALTGFASPQDREAALSAGFNAHIAKPVEPSDLVAALDEVLPDES